MHDIFFFTDVHGQMDLFKHMYNWCMEQDPECMIIFGGDACDRGEDGYSIMQCLLNLPNVVYLKGNHEDMFVKACDEIIGYYARNDELYDYLHNCHDEQKARAILHAVHGEEIQLSCYNGGFSTLRDWLINGADEEFVEKIRELPIVFSCENFDFCHSAAFPQTFDNVATAGYNGMTPPYYDVDALLWNRNSLNYGWTSNRIVVFGHTPTTHLHSKITHGMTEENIRPCAWQSLVPTDRQKRNGWKIDMDTGMTWTGRGYVLNILTMHVYGFYDPHILNPDMSHDIVLFENYKII